MIEYCCESDGVIQDWNSSMEVPSLRISTFSGKIF
jgi:hypothetical protein